MTIYFNVELKRRRSVADLRGDMCHIPPPTGKNEVILSSVDRDADQKPSKYNTKNSVGQV